MSFPSPDLLGFSGSGDGDDSVLGPSLLSDEAILSVLNADEDIFGNVAGVEEEAELINKPQPMQLPQQQQQQPVLLQQQQSPVSS